MLHMSREENANFDSKNITQELYISIINISNKPYQYLNKRERITMGQSKMDNIGTQEEEKQNKKDNTILFF